MGYQQNREVLNKIISPKKVGIIFTLLMAAINIFFFQNFDFENDLVIPINHVDRKTRTNHAKELLGNLYSGSIAHRADKIKDLHVTIYETVKQRLPKKFKSQALAVAETLIKESQKYDFDPVFIMAVIKTESAFNPLARGTSGEIGLMQLKPVTAKEIAAEYELPFKGKKSLENPVENIKIGVAYFANLRDHFSGFANKYLSAYNMGAARVKKLYKIANQPNIYTKKVMKNYSEIYKIMVASRITDVVQAN